MKALILDENMDFSKGVASVLHMAGFETVCLDSFDAAFSEILSGDISMIFAPIFLRNADIGIFLSKIRSFENKTKANIPLIALSPFPMDRFFSLFPDMELFGYIEKPFSGIELVMVARKAAYFSENMKF